MIRHRERQARNNHTAQRLPPHIHPHPKAIQPEKHVSLILPEGFKHRPPGQIPALSQQRQTRLRQRLLQRPCRALQQVRAGEQSKRAPVGSHRPLQNPLGHRGGKRLLVIRIRRIRRHMQPHLTRIIKRRAQTQQFAGLARPDARLKIVQPPPNRQSRAGQNHRWLIFKQHQVQQRSHLNRRGMHHGLATTPLALHPIHMILQQLAQKGIQRLSQSHPLPAQPAQLGASLRVLLVQALNQSRKLPGHGG